ncbi:cytoplasmic protein [Klebsiella aerogenes]|nr:cytoplasmic protein [Klebsiella aerogenes]
MIGPGDVQWMTAGAGILHEEFHSEAFTRSGGRAEDIQLWVNLPAKDKMTAPAIRALPPDDPHRRAGEWRRTGSGYAGQYDDVSGPAHTFSPLNVWDLQLNQGRDLTLRQPEGWSTALWCWKGK